MLVVHNIVDNMTLLLVMRRSRAGKAGATNKRAAQTLYIMEYFFPPFKKEL